MRHKVDVRFVKRFYGTEDGDYSIFSTELVNSSDKSFIDVNRRFNNFSVTGDFSLSDSERGDIFTVTIEKDLSSRYPN